MKVVGQHNRRVQEGTPRLGGIFCIFNDMAKFPIDRIPAYLEEGISGVCTGGSATVNVFSNKRRIVKNDLMVIFPYQLASITDVSHDFSISYFRMPKRLFLDIFNGMCRLTPSFFSYMRKHFVFTLTEHETNRFGSFCRELERRLDPQGALYRRESVICLLRVFYWDLYVYYKNNQGEADTILYSHKEDLAFRFFCLIIEHHKENREVAFYADKLCISPKYLTMLISKMSGRSAKDWIVEYTILEIGALLKDTDLDIKDVVTLIQFHSQSLMSRFFRKHTGMTISQYRASQSV